MPIRQVAASQRTLGPGDALAGGESPPDQRHPLRGPERPVLAMSRPIVVTVCMDSFSESREPQQRPHPWHSSAGGGAVHSIKNELMRRNKLHPYSITSSALASSDGGTVRPSALAVFMLITNSNLVGCSTGRSKGRAPLRILST